MGNKIVLSMDQLNNVTGGSGQEGQSGVIWIVTYCTKEGGEQKEREFFSQKEADDYVEYLHGIGIKQVGITRCG